MEFGCFWPVLRGVVAVVEPLYEVAVVFDHLAVDAVVVSVRVAGGETRAGGIRVLRGRGARPARPSPIFAVRTRAGRADAWRLLAFWNGVLVFRAGMAEFVCIWRASGRRGFSPLPR